MARIKETVRITSGLLILVIPSGFFFWLDSFYPGFVLLAVFWCLGWMNFIEKLDRGEIWQANE